MDAIPAAVAPEDLIDISALRILDLRNLAQDEISCLAHLCGDVPARLQDLVNVIVDKSVFNESAGSRRQTYDRDRLPRNKERRLSSGSASAQLHLAIESAGRSHKDLILHLCRQLKISEKGDRALYQQEAAAAQPSGVVVEGNRSMSLKRMARASASLAGRADGAMAALSKDAPEVLVNGKELAMEVLHRSSKKMKTKEEARRRAAESHVGVTESQEEKQALLAVKITRISYENLDLTCVLNWVCTVCMPYVSSGYFKPVPLREGATSVQTWNDFQSPDAERAGALDHAVEVSEPLDFAGGSLMGMPSKRMKLLCSTCEKSFVNLYTLRRHAVSTGHPYDRQMLKTGIVRKKQKVVLNKSSLRCSCGNTYATPYTLRRHAIATGHSFDVTSTSLAITLAGEHNQKDLKREEIEGNAGIIPAKRKLGALLPARAWKSNIKRYSCRQCHRQFIRKKHFVRHMSTHLKRKIKGGKTGHRLLGARLSGLTEVKPRLGRPPKRDRDVDIKIGKGERKRKHERASPGRQVRSRKAEQSSRQTPGYIPSQKAQILTCQECGKVYDEFSRYTGHLSMHARLRKVLVGEASTPGSATLKKNMLNVKEVSALGFRKLLNDKTGTYLSGLPAKLLFSESHLANKQKGKV
ncbi:hypothetical protein L7F22_052587 [Adiantum nelumboides]|nr:hypothetical protein [Adiantum nelumboides]